jgi:hypothetical protein
MRVVPFALQDVSRLAIATAVLAALLRAAFWFDELITRLIKVVS